MIILVFANTASAMPLFVTVIVQLNVPFCATLPVTLFVFVTVRSASERYTVTLDVFEVTLPIVAEAVLVTRAAVISAAVTVYVAVQVRLSPGSNQSSRSPTVLTAGQVTVALSSVTVTGPSRGANPLFVTR